MPFSCSPRARRTLSRSQLKTRMLLRPAANNAGVVIGQNGARRSAATPQRYFDSPPPRPELWRETIHRSFSPSRRVILEMGSILFSLLLILGSVPLSRAQSQAEYREWLDDRAQRLLNSARDGRDDSHVGAEHASRVRDDLEAQKRAMTRKKTYSYAEPVLSPEGKEIAALVNEVYMTLEDLNSRVRAAMVGMDPINHPDPKERQRLSEDRYLAIANQMINDWVMSTMLATQGRAMGYKATETEVNDAILEFRKAQAELAGSGSEGPQLSVIGIRESQLRSEIRDSLIIEKYINALVDIQFDENEYRRIYNLSPASFAIPGKARAFHVFHPLPLRRDPDELRGIEKSLGKIQKRLRRTDDKEMAEIVAESKGQSWTAGDMGWVTSDSQTMDPTLMRALFGFEVGEASPVFQTRDGYHVLSILDREAGSPGGLEHAKPQIRNYLFTKTKYATYESLKSLYDIRFNTGGIKRWRELSSEEAASMNARNPSSPKLKEGITIAELRRELEAERQTRGVDDEDAREPSAPRAVRNASEPEVPAVDLSILQ